MGILNVTPDSFSDGGEFDRAGTGDRPGMKEDGWRRALISSTLAGSPPRGSDATPVSAEPRSRRVFCRSLRRSRGEGFFDFGRHPSGPRRRGSRWRPARISSTTCTARSASRTSQRLAADTGAGLVIMHTGRDREKPAPDVIDDEFFFLERLAGDRGERRVFVTAQHRAFIRASVSQRTQARRTCNSWRGSWRA